MYYERLPEAPSAAGTARLLTDSSSDWRSTEVGAIDGVKLVIKYRAIGHSGVGTVLSYNGKDAMNSIM